MNPALRVAGCGLLLILAGCAGPVRLLRAPHAEAPAAAAVVTVEIHVWDRFGRQSLPLRNAGREVNAIARRALEAALPASRCAPVPARPAPAGALALYQRVATVWLADPDAARAGLGIGPGLRAITGRCPTALILLGQQLPASGKSTNWLSLGAVNAADGRLLRLAAVPLTPEEDLRSPDVVHRRVGQLVESLYR